VVRETQVNSQMLSDDLVGNEFNIPKLVMMILPKDYGHDMLSTLKKKFKHLYKKEVELFFP
jgi:hypothetical protein